MHKSRRILHRKEPKRLSRDWSQRVATDGTVKPSRRAIARKDSNEFAGRVEYSLKIRGGCFFRYITRDDPLENRRSHRKRRSSVEGIFAPVESPSFASRRRKDRQISISRITAGVTAPVVAVRAITTATTTMTTRDFSADGGSEAGMKTHPRERGLRARACVTLFLGHAARGRDARLIRLAGDDDMVRPQWFRGELALPYPASCFRHISSSLRTARREIFQWEFEREIERANKLFIVHEDKL